MTVFRFQIELADLDRNRFESLDVRTAQHPSETNEFLAARVLAYAIVHEDGIAFGSGISTQDEPVIVIRHPDGSIEAWIDVGVPTIDRLRKATRGHERVILFCHRDARHLLKQIEKTEAIDRSRLTVYVLEPRLLAELGARLDRKNEWHVLRQDGVVRISIGDFSEEVPLTPAC